MTNAPNMPGMLSGEKQVRLVIQSVPARGNATTQYRLVVYPEREGFRGPLIFTSREQMLGRLLAAIPEFEAAQVREPDSAARILYAGTLHLTDFQVAKLYGQ